MADAEVQLRVAPVGPQGQHRLEHEQALVERGVGHAEAGFADDGAAEGEEVAIEHAGRPAAAAAAAEIGLGAFQECEELALQFPAFDARIMCLGEKDLTPPALGTQGGWNRTADKLAEVIDALVDELCGEDGHGDP